MDDKAPFVKPHIRTFVATITIVITWNVTIGRASDLETLARSGYGVAEVTRVQGEYNGCDFQRQIPLYDGLVFECQSYSYHYAYSPEVLILKNVLNGGLKVVIDGMQVNGNLYRK